MATFVLIHGSWQGAWCWREIVKRLEEEGHQARALDLPGHGDDPRPPADVTLEDYVAAITAALRITNEPSILVGHSMTGQITQSAQVAPANIRALVYIAGILTPNGVSMMRAVESFDPDYAAQIVWSHDRRTASIQVEGARRYFYHLCSTKAADDALARFTPQPVAPFETPIRTTPAGFGRVPRYYVECLQDRAIPIALQRSMQSAFSWEHVYSIDTDHSPFISAPEDLVSILTEIARKAG